MNYYIQAKLMMPQLKRSAKRNEQIFLTLTVLFDSCWIWLGIGMEIRTRVDVSETFSADQL